MYCGSVYGKIIWKLKITPIKTMISAVNRICLQIDQYKGDILAA